MTQTRPLTDIDRAAFDLAIEIARKDPAYCRRIDDRLAAGDDYAEVGRAAAYHCQIESLGLQPWQSPPYYPTMSALDQPYGDASAKRELAELALAHAALWCLALASRPGT